MTEVFIDVTQLHPKMKHPTIFDAFDNVDAGGSVIIHNDHDPKPLYYQLLGERGNCFTWNYISNGPEVWEVAIKKNPPDTRIETVGEIASKDLRKAEYLKKIGIDFCCGGKRTIEEACSEKGLDVVRVKDELEHLGNAPIAGPQLDYNSFSLSFLADYIVNIHHAYVNANMPVIEDLAQKVAIAHRERHPFLGEVYNKFNELRCELSTHMKKEEHILFPYIKSLEGANHSNGFNSVQAPISIMERDHEIAGDLLKDIRKMTGDYTIPKGACNSLKLLYKKLVEFEDDLHLHIHLENNILFPKAVLQEKK
jgi:regulator of cell morphogenesis and NO signaling